MANSNYYNVIKAITDAWKTSGAGVPSNNGLYIGSSPQKVCPIFACLTLLPGKLILTLGPKSTSTNIDRKSVV